MSINITEKKIKSKIKLGETVAVVENIKYPFFESEKHKKLCSKMNQFYSSVAQKYSFHLRNKLPKKIKLKKLNCKLPVTAGMNYTASVCHDKIISVVLDLNYTEGNNIKTRRFSQMWSMASNDILPLGEVLKTDRQSRKRIFAYVSSAAKENSENPAFGYYDDYRKRLLKSFDIGNCFAVPNGLCFFINAGILSPVKYGANSFVLPFEKLDGVIKADFLPVKAEKEVQNTDIVNNV